MESERENWGGEEESREGVVNLIREHVRASLEHHVDATISFYGIAGRRAGHGRSHGFPGSTSLSTRRLTVFEAGA